MQNSIIYQTKIRDYVLSGYVNFYKKYITFTTIYGREDYEESLN